MMPRYIKKDKRLKYIAYLIMTSLVVAFDQYTKKLAVENLSYSLPIDVGPFLQWILVFNKGAAFGFLHDAGGYQFYLFCILGMLVSVVLLIWIWRVCQNNMILSWALSLILAGAVGNLVDRVTLGQVVDFINLHYQRWYFPAFNVADMAITLGAILLLYDSFFGQSDLSS